MTEPTMRFIGPGGHLVLDETVPIYIKRSRLRTLRRSGIAWLVRGVWVGILVGQYGRAASFCAFEKVHNFDGTVSDLPSRRLAQYNCDASALLDVQMVAIAVGGFEPESVTRIVDSELRLTTLAHPSACCPDGIPYAIHALDREPREIAYRAFKEHQL